MPACLLSLPPSLSERGVQSGEGGLLEVRQGSGRAWELCGLPTAKPVPCPFHLPGGHSGYGGASQLYTPPAGALRAKPQLRCRTMISTLCGPLLTIRLWKVETGCVHEPRPPHSRGLDLRRGDWRINFSLEEFCDSCLLLLGEASLVVLFGSVWLLLGVRNRLADGNYAAALS